MWKTKSESTPSSKKEVVFGTSCKSPKDITNLVTKASTAASKQKDDLFNNARNEKEMIIRSVGAHHYD